MFQFNSRLQTMRDQLVIYVKRHSQRLINYQDIINVFTQNCGNLQIRKVLNDPHLGQDLKKNCLADPARDHHVSASTKALAELEKFQNFFCFPRAGVVLRAHSQTKE